MDRDALTKRLVEVSQNEGECAENILFISADSMRKDLDHYEDMESFDVAVGLMRDAIGKYDATTADRKKLEKALVWMDSGLPAKW